VTAPGDDHGDASDHGPGVGVGAVFAALSDPTRRQVVARLAGGESTATELAGDLPVSRQAIAKHLAVLGEADLVASRREGRETRYRLTPEPLAGAMGWMASVGGEWDQRLVRLRELLEG
jgi:ArsR family transcriptional regulator, cadmium/lead-responsive transcriptional repressor